MGNYCCCKSPPPPELNPLLEGIDVEGGGSTILPVTTAVADLAAAIVADLALPQRIGKIETDFEGCVLALGVASDSKNQIVDGVFQQLIEDDRLGGFRYIQVADHYLHDVESGRRAIQLVAKVSSANVDMIPGTDELAKISADGVMALMFYRWLFEGGLQDREFRTYSKYIVQGAQNVFRLDAQLHQSQFKSLYMYLLTLDTTILKKLDRELEGRLCQLLCRHLMFYDAEDRFDTAVIQIIRNFTGNPVDIYIGMISDQLREVMEEPMMIRYLKKLKAYQDIQLSSSTYENMVSCLSNLTEPPLVADLAKEVGELYLATQGKASSAAGRAEGRAEGRVEGRWEGRSEGEDATVDWKGFMAGELGLNGQLGRAFQSIQNKVRVGRFSKPCVTEFVYKGFLLFFTYMHIMRIVSPACGVNLMQAFIAGPMCLHMIASLAHAWKVPRVHDYSIRLLGMGGFLGLIVHGLAHYSPSVFHKDNCFPPPDCVPCIRTVTTGDQIIGLRESC